MQCFRELGKPTEELSHIEFRDDGRYEIKCSFRLWDDSCRKEFEVLFEIRAWPKTDRYYWFMSSPCHHNEPLSQV